MYGYVYKTTNKLNGKIYVGQKKGVFNPSYFGSSRKLRSDVLRYGEDSFEIEVIGRFDTLKEAMRHEADKIKELGSRDTELGYNISRGFEGMKEEDKIDELPSDKVVGSVYETTDYNKFEFMRTNRDTNENHVKKLKKEIKNIGQINPILVDIELKILDGQHRFLAIEEIGVPLKYIVSEHRGIEAVKSLNTVAKRWTIEDYVSQYSKEGNDNYKYLSEVHSSLSDSLYNIPITTLAKMMKGDYSLSSVQVAEHLRAGKLNVHNKERFSTFIEDYKIMVDTAGFSKSFPRELSNPLFVLMAYNNFDPLHFQKRLKVSTNRELIQRHWKNTDGNQVFNFFVQMYNELIKSEKNKIQVRTGEKKNDIGVNILEYYPLEENLDKELVDLG